MSYTPLADTIFSGDARAVTPAAADNDTSIATTAFVQTELGDYLALAGGTMTGDITLGSGVDINFNDTNSGLQWSDARIDRASANVLALGAGDKLQQNEAPTAGDDLTNKTYVDGLIDGIYWKDPVDLATTGDITLSGEQTIDGTLTSSSRVLVKDQTTASENGIYLTDAGAWTREADADSGLELDDGATVWVKSGSANGDTRYTQTATVTTIGTDSQTWVQTGSTTSVTALSDLTDADTTGAVDGALFRFESTGSVWNDTTTLLYDDNGQLQATTTGSSAGLVLGGDAQWYRSAADTMRTPDALVVDGTSTLTGQVSAPAGVLIDDAAVNFDNMATGTTTILDSDVSGDGNKRLIIDASGTMLWGSGSAVGDTNLYRGGADLLQTDDALTVAGAVTASSTLDVTGATTLSAGVTFAVRTETANYSVDLATDYIILADNSGDTADLILTLPAAHNAGDVIHVKDAGGNAASGTNQILISPDAGDSIDGLGAGVDFELTVDYQAVTLVSDGTDWNII